MFDNEEELPEEIVQQYLEGLSYHIEQGMFSRKHLEYINKKAITKLNEVMDDGTPKNYLDKEQGVTAYSKILDTGITAQEALEYVALCYGKDKEWVEEVKNNNYLHAKEVYKDHKDHPVQKAMLKDGTMRSKALKCSRTPNEQLRELHSQRKLHSTLTSLTLDNKQIHSELDTLKAKTIITESNLDVVMSTLDLDQLSLQEKASKLKYAGLTQSKISDHLGVHISTIKRWWESL